MSLTPITGVCEITTPGDYYIANDITITDTSQLIGGLCAIRVPAAGVRINMNGKKLRGVGLPPNQATYGVYGDSTNNLVLFDGRVGGVTGFWCGIHSATPWTRLQELDLSGNFYMGANLTAHTPRLYYNRTDNIGGVTNEPYAIGLNIGGGGAELIGNTARNLYRQAGYTGTAAGEGVHIILNASAGSCVVEYNRVDNAIEAPNTIGIFAGQGGAHTVQFNVITGFNHGIMGGGTAGSYMTARSNIIHRRVVGGVGISAAYGLVENNTVLNCATPLQGGAQMLNNTVGCLP